MKAKFWGVRGSIPAPLTPAHVRRKVKECLMGAPPFPGGGPGAAGDVQADRERAVDVYLDGLGPLVAGTVGGNTPCVEVRAGNRLIVLDAGSGLRELGIELIKQKGAAPAGAASGPGRKAKGRDKAAETGANGSADHAPTGPGDFAHGRGELDLFISHTHWDHILGLPFFLPLYVEGNRIRVRCPLKHVEEGLKTMHSPSNFPVPWEVVTRTVSVEPLEAGEIVRFDSGPNGQYVQIENVALMHPGGSYAYRITETNRGEDKVVVYATDSEYKDLSENGMRRFWDFFREADLLIFDAQYTLSDAVAKEDWGHSSSLVAVDASVAAGVKRLALFHHEPAYDDDTIIELLRKAQLYADALTGAAGHEQGKKGANPKALRLQVLTAYEGLEILI